MTDGAEAPNQNPMTTPQLFEIFVLAPFLLYLAFKSDRPTRTEGRVLLGAAGMLAIYKGVSRAT